MVRRKRRTQAQRSAFYGGLISGFPVDQKTAVAINGPKAETVWERELKDAPVR